MARSKQSTALFEVISGRGSFRTGRRGGVLASIGQWFRRSPRDLQPAAALATASPPVNSTPSPGIESANGGQRASRLDIDGDRYEITLRCSYASAIICGFAIVTLFGVAFIAGRKMSAGPRPAFAGSSTNEIRSQPLTPDVLILEKKTVEVGPPDADAGGAARQGQADPRPPANAPPRDRVRTKGLNYVLIQSYPEEKMAADAVKLLADNGIDCTIEKGIPGWRRDWCIVMGLEGFDHLSKNPRYDAYLAKIREVSDKNYSKKGFKAFQPTPCQWGKNAN